MKTFKKFVREVAEPRGKDEKRFKAMHVDSTDKVDYPVAGQEHVFKGTVKAPSRVGDIDSPEEVHYDAQYVDNGDEGEVEWAEDDDDEDDDDEIESRVRKLKNMSMMDESVLVEAVKPGTVKLNDGSSQKITKEDATALNTLFTQLNDANRKKMESRMTASKGGYSEVLEFAKNILD